MKYGIRLRFALWLIAALVPVGIAAVYVFGEMEDDVSARVAADLEGVRRLEASRIENALGLYRAHGENLAAGVHIRSFTAAVVTAREQGHQTEVIGGYDGFKEIDAQSAMPLQELAGNLQRKTDSTTAEVAALQLRSRSGEILGSTAGFDWEPTDPTIMARAMESGRALIGDAYRDSDGGDRVGLVVPIIANDGENAGAVVGTLVLENDLGPIVSLLSAHEDFGATSEAHLVQSTPEDHVAFITALRFEADAAFNKVIPVGEGLPINPALAAPGGVVLFGKDYRGEESIMAIETLDGTGWGLIVKIDRAEALEPVLKHSTALKGVAGLGVLGVLFGWAAFLDPIARRLRRLAEGAERVASGEYDKPLDDRRSDELGSVAKNIDRLATDLAADIAVRTDVESRLRYQASHDSATGIFNRQHATALMRQLVARIQGTPGGQLSVLFMDLDNFKAVNDSYGHATGDAVLATTAARLKEVAGDRGYVARWGGDEFIVVLPNTAAMAAQTIAVETQRAFEAPVVTSAGPHQAGASIGVATMQPGQTLEQLLQGADEAMFVAKQNRRSRAPAAR